MSSPIVDMSRLFEKPGVSVIRHRICFRRTCQSIIQLPWIVWSSVNRCHQEDWDSWPASKRCTPFGGGSVHSAQKYWHPVRVHKKPRLSYNKNEKPNSSFSVQARRNHGIDENSHGENFKWDEVQRTPIIFAANFRRNCAQIPRWSSLHLLHKAAIALGTLRSAYRRWFGEPVSRRQPVPFSVPRSCVTSSASSIFRGSPTALRSARDPTSSWANL
jgi:hypothetical protein